MVHSCRSYQDACPLMLDFGRKSPSTHMQTPELVSNAKLQIGSTRHWYPHSSAAGTVTIGCSSVTFLTLQPACVYLGTGAHEDSRTAETGSLACLMSPATKAAMLEASGPTHDRPEAGLCRSSNDQSRDIEVKSTFTSPSKLHSNKQYSSAVTSVQQQGQQRHHQDNMGVVLLHL
jgi:hypothetical protein